jgi:phosphatidylserine decarboxylase
MNDINMNSIEDFIVTIQRWYNINYDDFAVNYDNAVNNVQAIPEGTDPYVIQEWKNANIDDLCHFFAA